MDINITSRAKEELKKYLKSKKLGNHPFRIYVASFGWGGPNFGIALDEQKDGDVIKSVGDLTFLIEEDLVSSYKNFVVDYNDGWFKKGFNITSGVGNFEC